MDLTVVATSLMVPKALAAAEALEDEISVEVIDPRTLVPLDLECICESVRKTGRLLVVQEACTSGGFGSEIIRRVTERCFDDLDSAPQVHGSADVPMPFSPPLEQAVLPQQETITAAIRSMVA